LDGSELAEHVLPTVAELLKQLNLNVILFRTYNIPYTAYAEMKSRIVIWSGFYFPALASRFRSG